jgi:hypothetical protein
VGQPDRAVALAERWQPESFALLARLHVRAGRFTVAQEYQRKLVRRTLERNNLPQPRPLPASREL